MSSQKRRAKSVKRRKWVTELREKWAPEVFARKQAAVEDRIAGESL